MNLTTSYLGLELKNPLIASASPLNGELENIRQLEDFGAAAIVLPSIFEEQIEHEEQLIDQLTQTHIDSYGEALTYFPSRVSYAADPERYLTLIRRAVDAVEVPVIASLNGYTNRGWVEYARRIEQAGAHALELNIYFIPSDPNMSGGEVEQRYIDIVKAVKAAVTCPIAVKIGPHFSSIAHMALRLEQAGADGLVLFNRFYEPDIDLARLTLVSNLELSTARELRLQLLWIGVLAGRIQSSLAASTGVESADDVIKYLLVGADVVMTTSSLLRHGIGHLRELLTGLENWLAARKLDSLAGIRGRMSHRIVADPAAFERANYIKTLRSYQESSPSR